MTVRRVTFGVLIAGMMLAAAPALAGPDNAAQKFEHGQKLLADGNFAEALRAFTAAAKAAPDNEEYRQQAALLRRVIKMQQMMASQEETPRWLSMSEALHTYYHENGVYAEALVLDRKVHAQLNTGDSAARLARSELALGMNAEAAKLLGDLPAEQATPEIRMLTGIALARQGQTDDARSILADCQPPEKAGCQFLCDRARLCALVGDTDGALKMLTCCFEQCPPGQLCGCRAGVKRCEDFTGLQDSPGFAKALATQSKVKGGCCGGKAAGNCDKPCGDKGKQKAGCKGKKPDRPCTGQPKQEDDQP